MTELARPPVVGMYLIGNNEHLGHLPRARHCAGLLRGDSTRPMKVLCKLSSPVHMHTALAEDHQHRWDLLRSNDPRHTGGHHMTVGCMLPP